MDNRYHCFPAWSYRVKIGTRPGHAPGLFMCALHDAQAAVPDESLKHYGPPLPDGKTSPTRRSHQSQQPCLAQGPCQSRDKKLSVARFAAHMGKLACPSRNLPTDTNGTRRGRHRMRWLYVMPILPVDNRTTQRATLIKSPVSMKSLYWLMPHIIIHLTSLIS